MARPAISRTSGPPGYPDSSSATAPASGPSGSRRTTRTSTGIPSDFDLADWQRQHTALLARTTEWWEDHGAKVRLEQQNAFRLRGETAVLAGRPDLVAIRNERIDVIDVKTGEPRPWHYQQMLLYMYALRISLDVPFGVHLAGEIVYPDKTVNVRPGAVHQGFVRDLGDLIRRLASDRPARKVPSGPECRFCDIGLEDCPDRVYAGRVAGRT